MKNKPFKNHYYAKYSPIKTNTAFYQFKLFLCVCETATLECISRYLLDAEIQFNNCIKKQQKMKKKKVKIKFKNRVNNKIKI